MLYINAMSDPYVGRSYARWTVVTFAFAKPPHKYYLCRCECGAEKSVQINSVVGGYTQSCGCLRREVARRVNTKHGLCAHPAYNAWSGMKKRCENPNAAFYKHYGGRGITVCDEWQEFQVFWNDMGSSWVAGLTIDRIDVNGNYEKSNCKWSTKLEQGQNKRNSLILETPWGRMTQAAAARAAGISTGSLVRRIKAGRLHEAWFPPNPGVLNRIRK